MPLKESARLISYGGGDNIATRRPLTTEEEWRRWESAGGGGGGAASNSAGPGPGVTASRRRAFNTHGAASRARPARPPPTSQCLASGHPAATKDFMNIDIGTGPQAVASV